MSELLEAFAKNTKVERRDGRVDINCKLGLWGVSCPSFEEATREALHYFQQYYGDGEYGGV